MEYKYSPLTEADGIRLLRLRSNPDPTADLQGDVFHTTLSQCDKRDISGNYTALSYVWGDPQKTEAIHLGGGSVLKITSNLHTALRDIRLPSEDLLMWADAICMNQLDEVEKERQIMMMSRIYAGAIRTIIYLGPPSNSDEDRAFQRIRNAYDRYSHPKQFNNQAGGVFGGHDNDTDVKESLKSIDSRPWFSRVWVFQELVFSEVPYVQIGRERLEWDAFINSAPSTRIELVKHMQGARLRYRRVSADISPTSKSGVRTSVRTTYSKSPRAVSHAAPSNKLFDLIISRRGLGVSDPRDMIYAHLGFSSDWEARSQTIQYSMPWNTLFQEIARQIALEHGIYGLLKLVEGERSGSLLPSWVPDWTKPGPKILDPCLGPILALPKDYGSLIFAPAFYMTVVAVTDELVFPQLPEWDLLRSQVKELVKEPLINDDYEEGLLVRMRVDPDRLPQLDCLWSKVYAYCKQLFHDIQLPPCIPGRHADVVDRPSSRYSEYPEDGSGYRGKKISFVASLITILTVSFIEPWYFDRLLKGKFLAIVTYKGHQYLHLLLFPAQVGDVLDSDGYNTYLFRPTRDRIADEEAAAVRESLNYLLSKNGSRDGTSNVSSWPVRECTLEGIYGLTEVPEDNLILERDMVDNGDDIADKLLMVLS